jgi:hypothetical protein
MTRFSLALLTVSAVVLLAFMACKSPSASAQSSTRPAAFGETDGVGVRYGSRNPRTCPTGALSGGNAPTPAQASMSLVCGMEGITTNSELILISEVTVQIGGGRSYNQSNLTNATDADVNAQVYPIRGSFKRYDCAPLPPRGIYPAGQQCSMYPNNNATGVCYKNTFGEWHCTMGAMDSVANAKNKVPPPTVP